MKHAAIYIRVSTDAQAEEGYSIDAQREMLQAHCVSKSIKNFEFYVDGGYSGATIDRPELKRLIEDARRGKLSHVVVYKLDRLSRSQKDTLFLIEDVLNPNGISFVSLQETIDTASPMGRLMIGILSAFAQLERENIRERTRMGMLERVKEGYWPGGGRPPFGYDYDPERGILIPNDDAETVRRIFSLYLSGYPLYRIAEMTGLKYERHAAQIICRKTYLGLIAYNGKEYQGRHRQIIDAETYERAMAAQRGRSIKKFRAPSDFLLTGLLTCGVCGAKMRYQKWGSAGHKIVCYSQDKYKQSLIRNPDCNQPKLWARDVEREVTSAMFSFSFELGEDGGQAHNAAELLTRQRDVLAKKLRRLYELYAAAEEDTLLETINAAKHELSRVDAQLDAERESQTMTREAERMKNELKDLENAWVLMNARERQATARQLINRVTLTNDEVTVEFSF
ncbi:integrase [Clostridia bacterium]|nr:integrase [Clostridia bacterium]